MFIIIAQIAKHNFTFVTSKTYQLQNSQTVNLDESPVSLIYEIFKMINIENTILSLIDNYNNHGFFDYYDNSSTNQ